MKKLWMKLLAVVCAAALLCPSCVQKGPVKIGFIGSLSGENALVSGEALEGAAFLLEKWNREGLLFGREIELLSEDDGGDPQKAMEAYRNLMEQGVLAIIGPTSALPALTVMQAAAEDGIPILTPTVEWQVPILSGKNCLQTCAANDTVVGEAVSLFAERGKKSAAILYDPTQEAEYLAAKSFADACRAEGLDYRQEAFAEDLTPVLSRIINFDAEVLILPGDASAAKSALRQVAAMGFRGEVCCTAEELFGDELLSSLYGERFCAVDSFNGGSAAFRADFAEVYGKSPSRYHAMGYDAASAILFSFLAVGEGKLKPSRFEELTAAFYMGSFEGACGSFRFEENGGCRKPVFIKE